MSMKTPAELMSLSEDELEKYLTKRTKKELIMYVMAFIADCADTEEDSESETEEEDEEDED